MRGLVVDRLLSGTAVALVLVGLSVANASETVNIDQRAIEAAIPALDTADVPPPSADDIGGPITASTNAAPSFADIVNDIPVPESANTPPPTVRDFAQETATSNLAAADQAIAEKLREMLGARTDRLIRVKPERTAAEAFYAARNFAPLWIENGVVSSRTKAAIARIRNADADGLDVSDYAIPDFSVVGEAMLAEAELKFTATILAYARHAQSGRVTPSRISQNIEMNPPVPEPASVLSQIADAKDIAKTLDQFNPPHAGFQALRRKLAESRGQSGKSDVVRIASGPVLKQGMKDDRVPQLRERLHVRGDNHDITYDASLVEAVKAVQRNAKMKPTGLLDQRTVDQMNGAKRTPDVELIVSNMERWRWLPRDLGKAHVMVNVPDFSVRVMRDGKTTFHTKIVVGKAITPTPMLTHVMDHIVVNPTWYVPPSIIYGEYLPALEQDPTVLSRMGLVVERGRDGAITIKQPPGERNALGRIKFAFPNKFLVYMHDTPDKNLFAHDKRAFSHGCMRVQYPDKYAEALLAIALPEQNYSAVRITGMYGKGETTLKFANRIPIYLTYMNAYVDENDKLVVRDDLYGYDGRVRIALKDDDRRFADSTSPTQNRATIEAQRASSRRYFDRQDTGDFFQRLFR